MSKSEKLGIRSSEYSAWHRTLGAEYLAVDLDFVEYRSGRGIVALIDVTGNLRDEQHIENSKKFIWARTTIQRTILGVLSVAMSVPAFFVIHTTDLSLFHVHDLSKDLGEYTRMNDIEYVEFIKGL